MPHVDFHYIIRTKSGTNSGTNSGNMITFKGRSDNRQGRLRRVGYRWNPWISDGATPEPKLDAHEAASDTEERKEPTLLSHQMDKPRHLGIKYYTQRILGKRTTSRATEQGRILNGQLATLKGGACTLRIARQDGVPRLSYDSMSKWENTVPHPCPLERLQTFDHFFAHCELWYSTW